MKSHHVVRKILKSRGLVRIGYITETFFGICQESLDLEQVHQTRYGDINARTNSRGVTVQDQL